LVAIFVSGCANRATSKVEPGVDLTAIKKVYVKKRLDDKRSDERGVNELIVEKLNTKGIAAQIGTDESPKGVDAVLTYRAQWFWDITWYLLELDVTLREPESNAPMAKGNSYHTSLTRLSPKEMVSEVIDNIFKGSK